MFVGEQVGGLCGFGAVDGTQEEAVPEGVVGHVGGVVDGVVDVGA